MADPINQPLPEDPSYPDVRPTRPGTMDQPVNKREAAARLQIRQEQAELAEVLASRAGQGVILRLMRSCTIYAQGQLSDFDQGRRDVGLELLHAICALGPLAYPQLLAANAQRAQDQANQNLIAST